MGTDFSAVLLSPTFPHQKLWRAVLVHAIEESIVMRNDRKSSIFKMQAYTWLVERGDDFKNVCFYGGFDPDNIGYRYKRAIEKGDVGFSEKQIAWGKYYKQFVRYKKCKDHGSRDYHRKRMEHLRACVGRASNIFVSMVTISALA